MIEYANKAGSTPGNGAAQLGHTAGQRRAFARLCVAAHAGDERIAEKDDVAPGAAAAQGRGRGSARSWASGVRRELEAQAHVRDLARNHASRAAQGGSLVGLCGCRTGHSGQLAVQTEIILECDRGQGLGLGLDRQSFLGFDRLVLAIARALRVRGARNI